MTWHLLPGHSGFIALHVQNPPIARNLTWVGLLSVLYQQQYPPEGGHHPGGQPETPAGAPT